MKISLFFLTTILMNTFSSAMTTQLHYVMPLTIENNTDQAFNLICPNVMIMEIPAGNAQTLPVVLHPECRKNMPDYFEEVSALQLNSTNQIIATIVLTYSRRDGYGKASIPTICDDVHFVHEENPQLVAQLTINNIPKNRSSLLDAAIRLYSQQELMW